MPPTKTYSIYSNTTFGIQKVIQNAYVDSNRISFASSPFNTVLGESYSDIINVTETISGVLVTKLYIAYISQTNPFNFDVPGYVGNDILGSIYIARFDINLKLEYIFRSSTLNTLYAEYTPKLIYGSRKLFLAYITEGTVSASTNVGDNIFAERESGDITKDLVLACLEPFNYAVSDNNFNLGQPLSFKDNLDILWLKQEKSFNNLNTNTIAEVSEPCLAYDSSNTILYCSFTREKSVTDTDINIVAVKNANGIQSGSSITYTGINSQLITLTETISSNTGTLNTGGKESISAIVVDDRSYLYLVYRTNASDNSVFRYGTKDTNLGVNKYILAQFAPPPDVNSTFGTTIFINTVPNWWSLRNIIGFPLTTDVNFDKYTNPNIVFYKNSIIISAAFFSSSATNSNAIATRMNLDSNYNFGSFQSSAAAERTGTRFSDTFTSLPTVRMVTGLKDPDGNENLFLIYDTYVNISGDITNTKMNLNIARYQIDSSNNFVFRDYTATLSNDISNNKTLLTDLEGINLIDTVRGIYKNSKSPSVCIADGCLIIAYETDGASFYYDSTGKLIQNIYGGNELINTNYDIAIAKITPFKPNAPRKIYLTESINYVEINWVGNLVGTNAALGVNNTSNVSTSAVNVVEWWPPTDGSKWGYRISYRKTGEEDFDFIDLFDISGKETPYYYSSDASGQYKARIYTTDSAKNLTISENYAKYNIKPLEKGYQYEFNLSALLNGAPGDRAITQGMPVDGYVINTINSSVIDKYLPSNSLSPLESDLFKDENYNQSIEVDLIAGRAYNIAIRSFVVISPTFTNYSLTDQSGIVIPRYAAPINVTTISGRHYIKVTWDTVVGENVDAYEIQYSTSSTFTTYSSLIHPSKFSQNISITLTNYLVYSESSYPNDDRDISLNTPYFVRIRALGGKSVNSINGIPIIGDKYGYKVYGLYGSASSSSQAIPLNTPINLGISGEPGFLESNSVTNNSIELRWSHIAMPTILSLMINGYRYNVLSSNIDGLFKIQNPNRFGIKDDTLEAFSVQGDTLTNLTGSTNTGVINNQTIVPFSGASMKSILFNTISGSIISSTIVSHIKLYRTEFTYTFWINIPAGVTQDIIPFITTSITSTTGGYNIQLVKKNMTTDISYYNLQFISISGNSVNKIICELNSELFVGKGWKHVSVIFNNTDIHLHIHNIVDNTRKSIYEICISYPDINNGSAVFQIGQYGNGTTTPQYNLPNGTYLSDFRFYGKALSEEQILTIKNDKTYSTRISILSQPYVFNITDASMNLWPDLSSNGVLKPSIQPGTQYNIILFSTNSITSDPSGKFLARKVITLGAAPVITDVSFSAFRSDATYNDSLKRPSSTIKYNATRSLDLSPNIIYYKPNNSYFNTYQVDFVDNALTQYNISGLYGGNKYGIYAVSNTGKNRPYYRPYIIRDQTPAFTSVDKFYKYFRIIFTHVTGKSRNVSLSEIGISGKTTSGGTVIKITPTLDLSSSPLKSGTISTLFDNSTDNSLITSDSALFYSNTDGGSFATNIAPSTIVDNINTIHGSWIGFQLSSGVTITGLRFTGLTPSALPDGIILVGSDTSNNWTSIYSNGYMTNPLVYTSNSPFVASINFGTTGLVSTTNIVSSNIVPVLGTVPSFIYNTSDITPPVDPIIAVNRRNQSLNLILRNIDHNRNVSSYTIKLYKNSEKIEGPFKEYSSISITDPTYSLIGLDTNTSYFIKFIANIDGIAYEFTTQPNAYKTTDIIIKDISVSAIQAGPQKLIFYLSRRVRSISNENILIAYIPENSDGTFTEANQIIKRFYVVDSSMIELAGLFPQRSISGASIRVEYFVSHTNDFNSSNPTIIRQSVLDTVKPGYFYPIAPKLTSDTAPLPLNTTYDKSGKARITWVPNEFRINYPNENPNGDIEFFNSASLPIYNNSSSSPVFT